MNTPVHYTRCLGVRSEALVLSVAEGMLRSDLCALQCKDAKSVGERGVPFVLGFEASLDCLAYVDVGVVSKVHGRW